MKKKKTKNKKNNNNKKNKQTTTTKKQLLNSKPGAILSLKANGTLLSSPRFEGMFS